MRDIVKTNELINLYEIYGKLLTEKQKEYFEFYFYEDYSLGEIAKKFDVSRNAVYDALVKISDTLYKFESNLHILDKINRKEKLYEKVNDSTKIAELIDQIKRIDYE